MSDRQDTIRRIILFAALGWLLMWLGPKLFPGPPVPVRPEPAVGVSRDSVVRDTVDSAARPVVVAATDDTSTGPGAGASSSLPVESLAVATSLTRYSFSNRGATVTGVELPGYRVLGGEGGSIALLRPSESLVTYSLRLGADTIPLGRTVFESSVDSADGVVRRVTYTGPVAGTDVRLSFEYTIVPDSFVLRLRGRAEGVPPASYLLAQLPSGLRSGEADSLEDQRHFAVAYKPERDDAQGISFSKLDMGEMRYAPGPLSWVALKSKYFIVGLLKPVGEAGFLEAKFIGGERTARRATHMGASVVDELSDGEFGFEIYTGPQEFKRLTAMGRDFQNSNPYGGFLQPIVQPFATIVMRALLWLKETTKLNYGWVLVVFGVLIRLLLWPLNQKAMRTSIRMQRIQPELQEVQKKYKSNPQKMQEELMKVYREHGMTPLSPLAGCLPMLIPMPVLFALFFVFQNTIEFRGVPFLWLPDISLKDPYYIIPIFLGVSMFVMSWMGSRGVPQNPQTRMMMYILPAMMLVLFLNFASGLNLYYAVQNVAGIPQQWLIARQKKKIGIATVSEPPPRPGAPAKGKAKS